LPNGNKQIKTRKEARLVFSCFFGLFFKETTHKWMEGGVERRDNSLSLSVFEASLHDVINRNHANGFFVHIDDKYTMDRIIVYLLDDGLQRISLFQTDWIIHRLLYQERKSEKNKIKGKE
jgi:hypothetical protein